MDTTLPSAGILDLLLRRRPELDALVLDERAQPRLLQRLLWVSLAGLAVHGLVLGAGHRLLPVDHPFAFAAEGPLWVPLAMMLSFLGASCLCLPSFWFYTQLAGLDATVRFVACQALRAQASTSTLLLGLTPAYTALVLAAARGTIAPDTSLAIGWWLPFSCGLYGMSALYRAFAAVSGALPASHGRRGAFLVRVTLAWAAVFTVVCGALLFVLSSALPHALFGR